VVGDLEQDRTIVVVCRSGNRSASATNFLNRNGLDAVNLSGGMIAWVNAGLPTQRG
jgi:rhodanese-related sulfurtransferase